MDAFLMGTYILMFPAITLVVLLAIWRWVWRDAQREKKDIV